MEELLELLNEYEKIKEGVREDFEQRYERKKEKINNGIWRCDNYDNWEGDHIMGDVAPSYIISKSYGFIEWLVDNDKIDIDKYYEFMTNENIDISNACGELDMDKEFYYELLMILAVQDNPIEFLISILK